MTVRTRDRRYRMTTLDVDVRHMPRLALLQLSFLLVAAVAVALGFVWFQRATERLQDDVVGLRRDLGSRGQEVQNLHVRLETYRSLPNIRAAVKRLQLQLRPAFPGQVLRVSATGEAPHGRPPHGRDLLAQR